MMKVSVTRICKWKKYINAKSRQLCSTKKNCTRTSPDVSVMPDVRSSCGGRKKWRACLTINLFDLAKAIAAMMKQNSNKPVMTLSRAML